MWYYPFQRHLKETLKFCGWKTSVFGRWFRNCGYRIDPNRHSIQAFHRVWKRLLPCLAFDAASYAPYGLRRGGATHHFLTLGHMDLTVARGRWSHAKTAKLYIDDGALALAETLWTSKQKRLVRKMARKFAPLCTQLRQ